MRLNPQVRIKGATSFLDPCFYSIEVWRFSLRTYLDVRQASDEHVSGTIHFRKINR